MLGLDIGERRIGVAVSDPGGRVATPVKVLDARALLGDPTPLRRLVEDFDAELIVIGLPLTMSGEEGPQARTARATGDRLARSLPIPVVYWDERLSSAEARRVMSEAGVRDADKRGKLDMVAAAVFLQSYLDAAVARESEGDGTADEG